MLALCLRFRPLTVALAALVLQACSTATTATLRGSLTTPSPVTLPPAAQMVVELRDDASGRIVAEQREALHGRQLPIAFALSADYAKVARSHPHTLRGVVLTGGQAGWITEPQRVDIARGSADLGELPMVPTEQPGAFASTLQCGDHTVTIGYTGNTARLTEGRQTWDLAAVRSASGSKFELAGDPTTFVWFKGDRATVSTRGQVYPECVAARGSAGR